MNRLGFDVGGSSIKGAPVDTSSGELVRAPATIKTPQPATVMAVAEAIEMLAGQLNVNGPIGLAVPTVVKGGVTWTAANIDPSWIGAPAEAVIAKRLDRPITLLNDGDAAGIAEMQLGAGRGRRGTVMVLIFGTGIGTALFVDGKLLPNTELGRLELDGAEVEQRASGRARTVEKLDWRKWADRVNAVLAAYQGLFWPDLFIIGGGVTEHFTQFSALLQSRVEIQPARFRAHAGIVGAALAANA
ncbi:MAG TPA: ROK family protein [Steroidobacteraceae bacterium]|nr:ROK family protein [Steroidobacteraceae bacterium]